MTKRVRSYLGAPQINGERARATIIEALPGTITELSERLGIARTTVKHHIKWMLARPAEFQVGIIGEIRLRYSPIVTNIFGRLGGEQVRHIPEHLKFTPKHRSFWVGGKHPCQKISSSPAPEPSSTQESSGDPSTLIPQEAQSCS